MVEFTKMLLLFLSLPNVLCLNLITNETKRDINEILYSINGVMNFVEKYYYKMNMDGLLGIILAQAQLEQILFYTDIKEFTDSINVLIKKSDYLRQQILPLLPKNLTKYVLFQDVLLKSTFWHNKVTFNYGRLYDLGIYNNWTKEFIMNEKKAEYNGVPTDVCLEEIMRESYGILEYRECHVSSMCEDVMLANRDDTLYLLTHRLLYLQIARQLNCIMGETYTNKYILRYCSTIWKETKTNEYFGFPQHDIFLEQVVLCGIEGFAEFLIPRWKNVIIKLQSEHGCYTPQDDKISLKRRNANVIDFGCTDHTTGLGAAALAINLRYLINQTKSNATNI